MKRKKRLGRKPRVGEGTRIDIIKSFHTLIYEIGPSNITIEKVAQKSGLTLGTIRYHFADNQTSLYTEALKFHLDRVYRLIEDRMTQGRISKRDQFNPLLEYIDTMFDWLKDPTDACFELYCYFLTGTKNLFPKQDHDFWEVPRARIASYIREGVGAGHFAVDHKLIDQLAHKIHNVILDACVSLMTSSNKLNVERNRELCLATVFGDILNAPKLRKR